MKIPDERLGFILDSLHEIYNGEFKGIRNFHFFIAVIKKDLIVI